jgi:hypothetical protein
MGVEFIYTGPSWANQSYDAPGSWEYQHKTNLAKEWSLPFHDYSQCGSSALNRSEAIKKTQQHLPIVWIYNEPLLDLQEATGLSMSEFIRRSDWFDIWKECNKFCLDTINQIGVPVFLIGGHSDVIDCKYENIVTGHFSWQHWIAEQAGLKVDNDGLIHVKINDGSDFSFRHCWGAEFAHRYMHENSNISPSSEIVDAVWNILFFWKELEKANLFFDVHPNRKANQEFAKVLLPALQNFLQDTK